MIGKEVLKEEMKTFFFPVYLFLILNLLLGIEACDAGILSNQA
jgi:hypothetical protein